MWGRKGRAAGNSLGIGKSQEGLAAREGGKGREGRTGEAEGRAGKEERTSGVNGREGGRVVLARASGRK